MSNAENAIRLIQNAKAAAALKANAKAKAEQEVREMQKRRSNVESYSPISADFRAQIRAKQLGSATAPETIQDRVKKLDVRHAVACLRVEKGIPEPEPTATEHVPTIEEMLAQDVPEALADASPDLPAPAAPVLETPPEPTYSARDAARQALAAARQALAARQAKVKR